MIVAGTEKDLESDCRELTDKAGGRLPKWVSPGNRGVPDRILLLRGRVVFIEFKRPDGVDEPLQRAWSWWLKRHGFRHEKIETFEQFKDLVWSILKETE